MLIDFASILVNGYTVFIQWMFYNLIKYPLLSDIWIPGQLSAELENVGPGASLTWISCSAISQLYCLGNLLGEWWYFPQRVV